VYLDKFTGDLIVKPEKHLPVMKKFLLVASLLMSFAGFSFAQTAPAKDAKKEKTVKATTPAKPATTATAAKPATTTTAAKPAAGAAPTKKDGTPDMRYKTNKDAKLAPAATHVKKDGTPDKRFKENKDPKKP
jgi:hypothetical protein